ncbi:5-oxoprolinase/urea amidolyase family protein [Leucobacter sp. USCH14]|uniref:5-oxoprolinase subunit B/C family protein n=1 Tax=Leucobacter sp. USCH14 TaxID=3024838 RepID=UPI00309D4A42
MSGSNRVRPRASHRPSPLLVRAVGDRACIVDLPDLDSVLGLAAILRERRFPGVIDIVPAARTVLVRCADRASARRIAEEVEALPAGIGTFARTMLGETARVAVIDVVYDGADLEFVGERTGLGVSGVIAAHTGARWTAAFGGFAPGFVYLTGGGAALEVPRRGTPRERVEAGSVGLAGQFSAVYPGASPGGWQLIGRTSAHLWDSGRDPAALLAPGDTVTFRAVREQISVPRDAGAPDADETARAVPPSGGPAAFTVLDPGLQTLVQDAGRAGHAAIGVSASGAADRSALRTANRAVGNEAGAAALETLNAAVAIRAETDITVALSGTDAEAEVIDDRGARRAVAARECAFTVHRGETLRIGRATRGLRGVLAIRGGISAPPVLGSASHDSLSNLGPRALAAGDALAIGDASASVPAQYEARTGHDVPGDEAVLRFVPGPRDEWFAAAAVDALTSQEWRVTPTSNRVGLRLEGAPLERARHDELPSEGTVRGSIQIPPDGQPVLFLADHPVTGGYPVIGTVVDADTDAAAQLRPGASVRFAPVDPDDAHLEHAVSVGAAAPRVPDTVRVSLEVDGRRVAVSVPGALAAALDRLAEGENRDRKEADRAAIAELLAEILAATGSR